MPLELIDPYEEKETPTNKIVLGVPGPRSIAQPTTAYVPEQTGENRPSWNQLTTTFKEEQIKRLSDPGVPLDMQSGLPLSDRYHLSIRDSFADQLRYMENKYGPDRIKHIDGHWKVRFTDQKTGKPYDVLDDADRMEWKDIVDFIGVGGDMAAAAIGQRVGISRQLFKGLAERTGLKGLSNIPGWGGLLGTMRDIVTSSGAVLGAGVSSDTMLRLSEMEPVDAQEILSRRISQFAIDSALGTVIYPFQRFLKWTRSPGQHAMGDIQFDAIEAQRLAKQKHGIDIPLSIGERSGSEITISAERSSGRLVGTLGRWAAFDKKKSDAIQRLIDVTIGTERAPSEQLARGLLQKMQTGIEPAIGAVRAAEKGVEEATQEAAGNLGRNINKAIMESSLPERLDDRFTGNVVKNEIMELHDRAHATKRALYDRADELGAKDLKYDIADQAERALAIYNDLPPAFIRNAETGLAEPSGEVAKSFIDEVNVVSRLKELMVGGERTLSSLRQMRDRVYDDINKGDPTGTIGARYQYQIADLLTDAMEKSVENAESPALRKAITDANTFYKNEVLKFQRKGISEMFAPETAANYVGPAQLTEKLVKGPAAQDMYFTLKEMLGEESLPFRVIKRSIIDSKLKPTLLTGNELVKVNQFADDFTKWIHDHEQVADDILGPNRKTIERNINLLKRAKEYDKIAASDLESLLKEAPGVHSAWSNMIQKQRDLAEAVRGKVLSSIKDGKLDPSITPKDLLNRFFDTAQPAEVKRIMAMVQDDEQFVKQLRSGFLFNTLQKHPLKGVRDVIDDIERNEVASTILGHETMNDLKTIVKPILESDEFYRSISPGAAVLSRWPQIKSLKHHPQRFARDFMENAVLSTVMTSRTLSKLWLQYPGTDPGAFMTLFVNPQFVEGLLDQVGDYGATANAINSFKHNLLEFYMGERGARAVEEKTRRVAPQGTNLPALKLVDPYE